MPDSLRARIAGGCFHTVIEHHHAIRTLVHSGLYGSALALIRPTFEAFVRGLWVARVAEDGEVERLTKDKFPPFGEMIEAIEATGKAGDGQLSRLKTDHWKHLCSLTHTGAGQIIGRLTPNGLGGDGFTDEEIVAALAWADCLAIQVVRSLGRLADRPNVVRAADSKAVDHFEAA